MAAVEVTSGNAPLIATRLFSENFLIIITIIIIDFIKG